MSGLTLVFVGTRSDDMARLRETAEPAFERDGFDVYWRAGYPTVPYHDVRAALRDGDLDRKNAEWVRSVGDDVLESLLDRSDDARPSIRGWGFRAEPDTTLDWFKIADALLQEEGLSSRVEYQILSVSPHEKSVGAPEPTKNANAPFSYDPAQDYYTEPNRE